MRPGKDAHEVMDDRTEPNPVDTRAQRLFGARTLSMATHEVDPAQFVRAFFPNHAPASYETGVSVHRPPAMPPMPAFPKPGGR